MDFFEELGTKITLAGQKTKQMTSNFADTAKLNNQIYELKKTINNQYTSLGELYYMSFGQQPVKELEELCTQIQKNKEELILLQSEMQRLKGFRTCPECGSENSIEANFCSNCSARLPALPKRAELEKGFCPECGAQVMIGVHFCSKCGNKLD